MVIGKVISHYLIVEKIGQGGLGEVFVAEDTILNRRVALKFLSTQESSAHDQILEEARSAASIDHPYACKIFETGQVESRPFIVMEFIEGETLAQRVKRGAIPIPEATQIAAEIAEALAAAHEKHIVHCDLKPANVMITRSGHVKLMDFGLARHSARAPRAENATYVLTKAENIVAGTPAYMAPEQAQGDDLDARTDVFALGVVLYEMLTGTNPFRKNTPEASLAAVIYEEPPRIEQILPAISAQLARVVQRALSKRVADRYSSARELLTELTASHVEQITQRSQPAEAAPVSAIAILPFTDLSPTQDQEYFCQGLAEELIAAIGKMEQIRVASRTAAFRYKNAEVDLKNVGEVLKVTSVLEGSVQKAGERVRIVVKLVDCANGYPVWSERYDRKLDDIFEIQDQISRAVVDKLSSTLAPAQSPTGSKIRATRRDVRAFELYLKGRYFWNRRTEADLRLSIREFESALAADPDYASAHAGLADSYVTLALYGAVRPLEVIGKARAAAERALQLDAALPEALTSRAVMRGIFDWDWNGAIREFEQTIRMHPHYAHARLWFAMNCLCPLGQFDRAREELEDCAELEPPSLATTTSMGILQFFERKYDQAISRFRAVLEMERNFYLAAYFLGQAYVERKMFDEAIRELERAASLSQRSPESLGALGCAFALAGRRDDAVMIMDELTEKSAERYVSPVLAAQVRIGLEEYTGAIANLKQAILLRSTDLMWLNVRPVFDPIRSDPRVTSLLGDLGFAAR